MPSIVDGGAVITPIGFGVNLARSFNGSSDFIDCGHNNTFLAPTAITVAAWVNPTSLTPAYSAIISRVFTLTAYYQLLIKSTGKVAYYAFANANVSIDPGSATISTSTWSHIAWSYDSTNGLKTYVNGVSDGTAAANGALSSAFTTQDLTFGEDTATAGRFFNGAMADMAIWSTNLSSTQISNLAAGRRANNIGANANLVEYLPILGQSPEPDQSGNSLNGTLTGTTVVSGPPTLDLF